MVDSIKNLVERQRTFFHQGETKSVKKRKMQLKALRETIEAREEEIMAALHQDLNKSRPEAFMTEIGFLYAEIKDVLKHLDEWTAPEKVKTPLSHTGSTSYIYREPYGVTLVIAPWNYPFQLAIAPLIGAIAAGNTAVVKPSEYTPNTSRVIKSLLEDLFTPEYVAVVEGDADVAKNLLSEHFDYIFFTGSSEVGKKVMKAAAENLTPVTLELGGKSPAIVMKDANVKLAAKRIVWGKFLNAGQTCVAPDYVLVHRKQERKLLKHMIKYIKKYYGEKVEKNPDFPKIVHEQHHDRLTSLLDAEKIIYGGGHDRSKRFIEPTVMVDVQLDDPVMKDEIFGPILPVITFDDEEEVLDIVRENPDPLALYLFTEREKLQEYILENVPFGGGCVNDTVYHLANSALPFGGRGASGVGAYHGKASFDTFTHEKSVLKQTTSFDVPLRYKQSETSIKAMRKLFQ
ncbi:aldehyde dehydrogenase [Texcoconibacillus texcoconensis]|uniref:Aldehyde dehydrogenase n=1 Tax=Texcoconibacillus texcoconensis TaxID=1095777 RepID=A0A840QTJ0_9BACI|nr:aldehyde dehydrogenase [Texcoconibacillus texcoconensis]MBB5174684.1 aldehyde dehydrogenase (NAD+) [Texcoconibacillus texcoconensis]